MCHWITPLEKLCRLCAHLLSLPAPFAGPVENAPTPTDCLLLLAKSNHVLEEVQPEDD